MTTRNFRQMLESQWSHGKFVCVGLDSEYNKIPEAARRNGKRRDHRLANIVVKFNEKIIDATKDIVCAYKINTAFYEKHGKAGLTALSVTIADIMSLAPDVPVILDAKRGDIGHTNIGYVEAAFDSLKADAVTVHPYLGFEALEPFISRADKGIFVLCRTSNEGSGEFQDIEVEPKIRDRAVASWNKFKLYEYVAWRVSQYWNKNGNCALVVGATFPDELRRVRRIVGDLPILIPGIGAQGGDVRQTVAAGQDNNGRGMIINSSRAIIFASEGEDYAEAARHQTEKLHNLVRQCM